MNHRTAKNQAVKFLKTENKTSCNDLNIRKIKAKCFRKAKKIKKGQKNAAKGSKIKKA